jgi:hypothetical protein
MRRAKSASITARPIQRDFMKRTERSIHVCHFLRQRRRQCTARQYRAVRTGTASTAKPPSTQRREKDTRCKMREQRRRQRCDAAWPETGRRRCRDGGNRRQRCHTPQRASDGPAAPRITAVAHQGMTLAETVVAAAARDTTARQCPRRHASAEECKHIASRPRRGKHATATKRQPLYRINGSETHSAGGNGDVRRRRRCGGRLVWPPRRVGRRATRAE